uniref:H15 domain-containing protein n=1 Tax=Laticauda laticaudata TaxID=8630 RepID=A0A8C5RG61_LATLA
MLPQPREAGSPKQDILPSRSRWEGKGSARGIVINGLFCADSETQKLQRSRTELDQQSTVLATDQSALSSFPINTRACYASGQFRGRRRSGEVSLFRMAEIAPAAPVVAAPASKATTAVAARRAVGAAKARKPAGPSVTELLMQAVAASKERGGISLAALKKSLAASGYDVEKNNSRIKLGLKSLVTKGTLLQTKGTGASGSFKLNKKQADPKDKAARKKQQPAGTKSARKPTGAAKKAKKARGAAGAKKPAKKVVKKAKAVKPKAAAAKAKKAVKSPAKARAAKPKGGKPKTPKAKVAKPKKAVKK